MDHFTSKMMFDHSDLKELHLCKLVETHNFGCGNRSWTSDTQPTRPLMVLYGPNKIL